VLTCATLLQVTLLAGDAGGADDIADSPATLVTFLQLLLHNFSMNSCATLDYWLGVLEKEIRDIVVSKHSAHITEVERLLRGKLLVVVKTCERR
jgi:hypothetical protein